MDQALIQHFRVCKDNSKKSRYQSVFMNNVTTSRNAHTSMPHQHQMDGRKTLPFENRLTNNSETLKRRLKLIKHSKIARNEKPNSNKRQISIKMRLNIRVFVSR